MLDDEFAFDQRWSRPPDDWEKSCASIALYRLTGFTSDVPELELSNGLRIRRFTDEDAQALRSNTEPRLFLSGLLAGTPPDESSWILEIAIPPMPYDKAEEMVRNQANIVRSALNICGVGWFSIQGPAIYQPNIPKSGRGGLDALSSFAHSLRLPVLAYHLTAATAEQLPLVFGAHTSISDQKLQMAIRRFDTAHRRTRHDDALIDFWIGLEALFSGSSTDVSFKVPLRVAYFVGASAEKRVKLFQQLRKSYTTRSDLVHGKEQPSDPWPHRLTAENALREALRKICVAGKPLPAESIEQAALAGQQI